MCNGSMCATSVRLSVRLPDTRPVIVSIPDGLGLDYPGIAYGDRGIDGEDSRVYVFNLDGYLVVDWDWEADGLEKRPNFQIVPDNQVPQQHHGQLRAILTQLETQRDRDNAYWRATAAQRDVSLRFAMTQPRQCRCHGADPAFCIPL